VVASLIARLAETTLCIRISWEVCTAKPTAGVSTVSDAFDAHEYSI